MLRRLLLNSGTTVLAFAVNVALEFVAIPVYVTYLGLQEFGLLAILTAVIGYFGLLDFGLPRGTTRLLSQSNDATGMHPSEVVSVSVGSQFVCSIVAGLLVYAVFPWTVSAMEGPVEAGESAVLRVLTALGVTLAVANGAGEGILRGVQRYATEATVFSATKIVTSGAGIVLAIATRSLEPVLATVTAFYALSAIGKLGWGLRAVRPALPQRGSTLRIARALLSFGSWTFADNMLLQFLYRAPLVVVGVVWGSAAAALYSVGYKLCVAIHGVFQAGTDVLFPHVGAEGGREGSRLDRQMLFSGEAIGILAAPLYLLLAIWAEPILGLWISPQFAKGAYLTLVLLVLAFYCQSAGWVGRNFGLGGGDARGVTYATTIGAVVLAASVVPGVVWAGAPGAAAAMGVASLGMATMNLVRAGRMFGVGLYTYLARLVSPSVPVLAGSHVVSVVIPQLLFDLSPRMSIQLPIEFALYGVLMLALRGPTLATAWRRVADVG